MKNSRNYLIGELILLFVFIPLSFILNVHVIIKAAIVLIGLIYVIRIATKSKLIPRKSLYSFSTISYWKVIFIRFALLALFTIIFMYFFEFEKLFVVVKKNPLLWLAITLFYSTLSVYPQELLYRSFFFQRYHSLFKKPMILMAVNAFLFAFAHIGFKNILVLSLTLIGGFVFALTYTKTKSLLFTSIEHAIYGSWLFTVGMGEMLAFPMPE